MGRKVLSNLRDAGFLGPIGLVNPKYPQIDGLATVKSLADLGGPPDLVIITAPAEAVPGIVAEAGRLGTAAAIVITAGLGHGPGSLAEQCRTYARTDGMRIVGPNGLGMLVPSA